MKEKVVYFYHEEHREVDPLVFIPGAISLCELVCLLRGSRSCFHFEWTKRQTAVTFTLGITLLKENIHDVRVTGLRLGEL